jgi:hypothetical protein
MFIAALASWWVKDLLLRLLAALCHRTPSLCSHRGSGEVARSRPAVNDFVHCSSIMTTQKSRSALCNVSERCVTPLPAGAGLAGATGGSDRLSRLLLVSHC